MPGVVSVVCDDSPSHLDAAELLLTRSSMQRQLPARGFERERQRLLRDARDKGTNEPAESESESLASTTPTRTECRALRRAPAVANRCSAARGSRHPARPASHARLARPDSPLPQSGCCGSILPRDRCFPVKSASCSLLTTTVMTFVIRNLRKNRNRSPSLRHAASIARRRRVDAFVPVVVLQDRQRLIERRARDERGPDPVVDESVRHVDLAITFERPRDFDREHAAAHQRERFAAT